MREQIASSSVSFINVISIQLRQSEYKRKDEIQCYDLPLKTIVMQGLNTHPKRFLYIELEAQVGVCNS